MKSLSLGAMAILAIVLIACQQIADSTTDSTSVNNEKVPTTAQFGPLYAPASAQELIGIWYVEYIKDRPVIDHSPARIQFTEDGAVNGNASCNRFFGTYTYLKQHLIIRDSLGATKMMCLPALMEQEQRLLEALPAAVQANVENGLLILRDQQGQQIVKASREQQ